MTTTTTSSNKSSQKPAGRVDMLKVDEALVRKYLGIAGKAMTGDIDKDVHKLLEVSYLDESKGNQQATCDTCGGQSPAAWPQCPFCGEGGLETGAVEVTAVVKKPTAVAPTAQPAPKKRSAAAPSQPPEPAKPNGKAPAKAVTQAAPAATKPAMRTTQLVAEKAKASAPKAEAKKATTAAATKTNGNGHAKAAAGPTEVLAPKPPKVTATQVKKLDEAITRIRELRTRGAVTFWEIGQELLKVDHAGSWKHRVLPPDQGGAPVHSSFAGFVKDELGFTEVYAKQMMAVATQFSLADVEKHGGSNLRIVVQLPPDVQAKALEMSSEGASKRDLEKLRPQREHPEGRRVTAILMAGQAVYEAQALVGDGKPSRAATSIKDEPWCEIAGENDTRIRIHLKKSPNAGPAWQFVVTVQRGKDAAATQVVDAEGSAVE